MSIVTASQFQDAIDRCQERELKALTACCNFEGDSIPEADKKLLDAWMEAGEKLYQTASRYGFEIHF